MVAELSLLAGRKASVPTQLFINNVWVDSLDGETFETLNPATGEKIADVSSAKAADVDVAVKAAR
jgi:aldehyde dehydrogenase (NAD+)